MQILKVLFAVTGTLLLASATHAAEADTDAEAREREIRTRYERVLLRNPFQERAFNQVYESYLKYEGIDAWLKQLEEASEGNDAVGALLLRGQVLDRQFKAGEAIAVLEKAREKGESRPPFQVLLGSLYYKVGQDDNAAVLLSAALDGLSDLDQRSSVCRMLGNLYLRQGKRDEAIAVWKRIAEQNPNEVFSQLELAEIYEDNRMWQEAIEVHQKVAALSADDPYRHCRALRSIAQCLVQAEKYEEAIATFEKALEMVAPGNWLFEDIKNRLVSVYEDIGDLQGLVTYLTTRLSSSPGDLELRDLLAETHLRMGKFDLAEKEYRTMLERSPRSGSLHEKLIALFTRTGDQDQLVATYEKLIELFPTDSEYLRRLGQAHLRDNKPDLARETWRRLLKDGETPEKLAELAGWFEDFEFPDEAIAAYEKAVAGRKNREWILRLAALKFQKGDEKEAVNLWTSSIDPATARAEDYAEVAAILEAHQRHEEATPLRKLAVEKNPAALEYRLAYARNLMVRKQPENALPEFEHLADQSENQYFTLQGEAGRLEAYREMGVLEEKQEEWERQLDGDPNNVRLLGALARLYERSGQREKALALYERRHEIEPDNVEFAHTLATQYKAARDFEAAIGILKGLTEKDRNRARVYYKDLLEIYLALDQRAEAIEYAEKIVSLAPADPEARLSLAQVYGTYREIEKSLQEYRHALRLAPQEPDYYRQYGDALAAERRWGEAQEAYRRMLDAAREDATRLAAVQNLARIYLLQGQGEVLITEFSRRVRNTPKKFAAYEELAAIHKEAGQLERSVETLESGLQAVDDKQDALRALIRASYELQDFVRTRAYYEQLLAMSGKPSPFEYDRLGSIYAQMGETEKAKEAWNQIIASNPDDPRLVAQLADIYRREGFMEEAVAMKGRAVELDPKNYKQRYDYAQMLAAADQPVQALEQARKILEMGEQEEAAEKESREKKVPQVARGQIQALVSPYQFMYGIGNYRMSYYGGGWQGGFKDFRPQVVLFMASLAQQTIGEEAFLQELQERARKETANTELKRDLIAVCQMYNRVEDALKVAQELLAIAPEDVELIQQVALYHARVNQHDKAIALLEKLAEDQPKLRVHVLQSLIPLYFTAGNEARAMELTDALIKENPSDISVIMGLMNIMQSQGKMEKALEFFGMLKNLDPRMRSSLLFSIANMYRQQGKIEDAIAIWKEILLSDNSAPGMYVPRRSISTVYTPMSARRRGVRFPPGMALRALPPTVIGQMDFSRMQAIAGFKQVGQSGSNAWAEVVAFASSGITNISAQERTRAWNLARFVIAQHIVDRQFEEAERMLQSARRHVSEPVEWFNLAIYMAEQQEDFSRMLKLYDELEELQPAKSREIRIAQATAAILARDFDSAAALIRRLNAERIPPAQFVAMVQPLVEADQKKLARTLLEEHLKTSSRTSQALQLLASLCAGDGEYDRAIELAHQAWDRRSSGNSASNPSWMYGGFYPRYGLFMPGMGQSPHTLLQDLHRYYVAAGRSEQLIEEFKERLAKQPGSVQAHENLAQLYILSEQRDKALEVYETLAARRPHLLQTRKSIANLHTQQGDFKKATEIYENLLRDHPASYQELSWELRSLYQRIGKGKDLEQIEEKLAEKARDPSQLLNMAQQFQNSGDLDRAAELYERAIKLSPQFGAFKNQLAQVYVQMGRLDDAVKLYREYLNSPQTRVGGYVDSHSLQQIAGLFHATGKIQELKDYCEAELKKNPDDQNAFCLQAQIDLFEKRIPKALEYYAKTATTGRDYNALYFLMQLADTTGDVAPILEIIEAQEQYNSPWDLQRVAGFYEAQGNRQKAIEHMRKWVDQQLQQGGGGWEYQWVMQSLTQGANPYWEIAEDVAEKHRRSVVDPNTQREFDGFIVNGYVTHGRFTNVVDPILARDTISGRDLDLIRALSQKFQQQNNPGKRRELLEKVLHNDPKNRELAAELAELYRELKEPGKRLEILERLVTDDPANNTYRERYADALIEAGRTSEAVASLERWAQEKPSDQRYRIVADTQKRLGMIAAARASLARAVELADSTRKADYEVRLAQIDHECGNPEPLREVLRRKFETRRDAGTFSEYLQHLISSGYNQQAYEFFVNNSEGFVDRYRLSSYFDLFLYGGDLGPLLDMNWHFLRYGEQYDREYLFRPLRGFLQDRGKVQVFLADLQRRVNSEERPNQQVLRLLGEAYKEAGFTAQAAEIFGRLIEKNPFDDAAISQQVRLLTDLGKADEAIELLRNRKPPLNLAAEVSQKIELIKLYMEKDRTAEAEAEIAALTEWARGSTPLGQIADAYFSRNLYEKALDYYEKAARLYNGPHREPQMLNMARCCVKLGQHERAREILKGLLGTHNSYYANQLTEWCLQEKAFTNAVSLLETCLEIDPRNTDATIKLARVYQGLGDPSSAVAALRRTASVLHGSARDMLLAQAANYLAREGLFPVVLEAAEKDTDGTTADLALATFCHAVVEPSEVTTIVSRLEKLSSDDPARLLGVGERLVQMEQKEAAAGWLNGVLQKSSNGEQRLRTALALERIGRGQDAVPAIRERLETHGYALLTNLELLEVATRVGDGALRDQVRAIISERAFSPAQKEFLEGMMLHYAGSTSEAIPVLERLGQSGTLPVAHLLKINEILRQHAPDSNRIPLLERVAAGGYGSDRRYHALSELVELHAARGNFAPAVAAYVNLAPQWGMNFGYRALLELVESVRQENYPAFRASVIEWVRANPQHDAASQLIGICSEVAEKIGTEESVAALLQEGGVSPREEFEAHAWSDLIEDWELSGPYDSGSPSHVFAPEDEYLKGEAGDVVWKKVTSKDALGIIFVPHLLGLSEKDGIVNKVAYARTTIESSEDGVATFAIGSDDWSKVWVNGKEVYSGIRPRSIAIDQDRFVAPLVKGRNSVLVKVGNYTDAWSFCLRRLSDAPVELSSRN